jgi:hypothetical protein
MYQSLESDFRITTAILEYKSLTAQVITPQDTRSYGPL